MGDIVQRDQIDQIRLEKSKIYFVAGLLFPLLCLAIIVFFYEGIGFSIPEQPSVIISMVLFYCFSFFLFLSISRFYKEDYDGFVTYLSLHLLFWFSSFIVFPYRYEVDTLVLYTGSIVKGTMISIMFSSVAIIPVLYLLWYRKRYEEEMSVAATIIAPLLSLILFIDGIAYFVIYRESVYINSFLLILLILSYAVMVITLTVISFVPSKIENFDRIWASLLIALAVITLVLFVVGIIFGDYISHRSYFLGGLYALFTFVPYFALMVAIYRSSSWNRLLFIAEANPDKVEFTYLKARN